MYICSLDYQEIIEGGLCEYISLRLVWVIQQRKVFLRYWKRDGVDGLKISSFGGVLECKLGYNQLSYDRR